jgi:hypothetical protein
MYDSLYTLPLFGRVVEDGYGRSCGLIGLIVSKLELEPQTCESLNDELCKPSLQYGERSGGLIVSRLELELEPPSDVLRDDGLRKPLYLDLRVRLGP